MGNQNTITIEISVDPRSGITGLKQFGNEYQKTFDGAKQGMSLFDNATGMAGMGIDKLAGFIKGPLLAAVVAFASVKTIQHFMDIAEGAEKVDVQLRQSLVTQGRYSDSFIEAMQKAAESVQDSTGMSAGALKEGQKNLILFGNVSEDQMDRATKVMADMAAVMGGDVPRAGDLLAKASQGITRGLKEVGVKMGENTFEAEGFEGVLSRLENKLAGQAEVLKNTTSGQWQYYENQVKATEKSIGSLFNTVLRDSGVLLIFGDGFKWINQQIKEFSKTEEFEAISQFIGSVLIGAIQLVIRGVGELVKAWYGWRLLFSETAVLFSDYFVIPILSGMEKVLDVLNFKGVFDEDLKTIRQYKTTMEDFSESAQADADRQAEKYMNVGKGVQNLCDAVEAYAQKSKKTTVQVQSGLNDEIQLTEEQMRKRKEAIEKINEAIRKSQIEIDSIGQTAFEKEVNRIQSEAKEYQKNYVDRGLIADFQERAIAAVRAKATREVTEETKKATAEIAAIDEGEYAKRITQINDHARIAREKGADEVAISVYVATEKTKLNKEWVEKSLQLEKELYSGMYGYQWDSYDVQVKVIDLMAARKKKDLAVSLGDIQAGVVMEEWAADQKKKLLEETARKELQTKASATKDLKGYELSYYQYSVELAKLESEKIYEETQDELLRETYLTEQKKKLWIEYAQTTDSVYNGISAGLLDIQQKQVTWGQTMYSTTIALYNSMGQQFGTLFCDIASGKLQSLGDYANAIWESTKKSFFDMCGKMAAQKIMANFALGWDGNPDVGQGFVEKYILRTDIPFLKFAYGTPQGGVPAGFIPGQAIVPGDSPMNDKVLAWLSPGEVVTPRSAVNNRTAPVLDYIARHRDLPGFWGGRAVAGTVTNQPGKGYWGFGDLFSDIGNFFGDVFGGIWHGLSEAGRFAFGAVQEVLQFVGQITQELNKSELLQVLAIAAEIAAVVATGGMASPLLLPMLAGAGMGAGMSVVSGGNLLTGAIMGAAISGATAGIGQAFNTTVPVSDMQGNVWNVSDANLYGMTETGEMYYVPPGGTEGQWVMPLTQAEANWTQLIKAYDFMANIPAGIERFILTAPTEAFNKLDTIASMTYKDAVNLLNYSGDESTWDRISKNSSDIFEAFGKVPDNLWEDIANSDWYKYVQDNVGGIISKMVINFMGGSGNLDALNNLNGLVGSQYVYSALNGMDRVPRDNTLVNTHKNEAILTAEDADEWRSGFSLAGLVTEIRALKDEVKAGNYAIARNTARAAKILGRFDDDGLPETRAIA